MGIYKEYAWQVEHIKKI